MKVQRQASTFLFRRIAYRLLRRQAVKVLAKSLVSQEPVSPRSECPVIVIGMHRSGTTLMVRLLQDLGVDMGLWKGKNTSEAYFFRHRNELMFTLAHASWDNPELLRRVLENPRWRRAFGHVAANDLGSLRSARFAPPETLSPWLKAGGRTWGFKDPRTSLTLPVWLDIFPNAKVINIVRHGNAVASSLLRRGQALLENNLSLSIASLEHTFAINLWAEYVLAAHRHCAGLSRRQYLEVRYENLLSSPRAAVRTLAEFVGLQANETLVEKAASRVNGSSSPAPRESPVTAKARQALDLYDYPV